MYGSIHAANKVFKPISTFALTLYRPINAADDSPIHRGLTHLESILWSKPSPFGRLATSGHRLLWSAPLYCSKRIIVLETADALPCLAVARTSDRKSTRLNSSHLG